MLVFYLFHKHNQIIKVLEIFLKINLNSKFNSIYVWAFRKGVFDWIKCLQSDHPDLNAKILRLCFWCKWRPFILLLFECILIPKHMKIDEKYSWLSDLFSNKISKTSLREYPAVRGWKTDNMVIFWLILIIKFSNIISFKLVSSIYFWAKKNIANMFMRLSLERMRNEWSI